MVEDTTRDRQRRRAWGRIKAGLHVHEGETLKFLSVTSAEESGNLQRDWKVFIQRLRRLTPSYLYRLGYISKSDLPHYYKGNNGNIRCDYFKVETSEGNGVIHCIFFGDFIPKAWIRSTWYEIHGAYEVDIRSTIDPVYSPRRLASYVVSQYIAGQSAMIRYSFSDGWVFKGFVKEFKKFIKHYAKFSFPVIMEKWDWWVKHRSYQHQLLPINISHMRASH